MISVIDSRWMYCLWYMHTVYRTHMISIVFLSLFSSQQLISTTNLPLKLVAEYPIWLAMSDLGFPLTTLTRISTPLLLSLHGDWIPLSCLITLPLLDTHNFHKLFIIQLFERLQPGSNGVLTNVDQISKEMLRNGGLFLRDLFSDPALSKQFFEPSEESSEEDDEDDGSEQEGYFSQQDRDEL